MSLYDKNWFDCHYSQIPDYLPIRDFYYFRKVNFKNKFVFDYGGGTGIMGHLAGLLGARVISYDPFTTTKFFDDIEYTDNFNEEYLVDIVICADVIEHLTDDEISFAIGKMSKILKPGGLLLLNTPNRWHLMDRYWSYRPVGHINPKSIIDIKNILRKDYKIKTIVIRGASKRFWIINHIPILRFLFGGHLIIIAEKSITTH